MRSVKSIRSVERAFAVLEALHHSPEGASLVSLKSITGLSGPTLLRLLKTLISVRAVRRSSTDGLYRNSVQLRDLARGVTPLERFADVASPWMDRLRGRLQWPSDLAVHFDDRDFMFVLESGVRQTPYYVRRTAGRGKVNILGSAVGAAFLCNLADEKVEAILATARASRDEVNLLLLSSRDWTDHLENARARQYSFRHPLYRGGDYCGPPQDDALSAMAVPIIHSGRLLGALNVNWNRAAFSEAAMARLHLSELKAVADEIANAVAKEDIIPDLIALRSAEMLNGNYPPQPV
jgi:IclR family transcriptional regulator, mhp operon transcriptional activator